MSEVEMILPEKPGFTPNADMYGMTVVIPRKDELKPCPFCGKEAVLEYERQSVGYADDFNGFSVHCSNHSCIGHNMFTVYLSSTEARAAWNRRANDEQGKTD